MIFDGHGGKLIIIDGHHYQIFGGRLMIMKTLIMYGWVFSKGYHPIFLVDLFF